jgi:chromosome segregation ATPase
MISSPQGIVEIPLSVRFLITPATSVAKWIWGVVVLRVKQDGVALTALFFSATGLFPVWISLAIAVSSVVVISLSISRADSKSALLAEANTALQTDKRALETTNQTLVSEKGKLQILHDDLKKAKEALVKDNDLITLQRKEAIAAQAPLNIKCDQLNEQIRVLTEGQAVAQGEKEQLTKEKAEAIQAKLSLETRFKPLNEELAQLRAQSSRTDAYEELNKTLEEFGERYNAVVVNQGSGRGATQMALETLIPQYQEDRRKWNARLQTIIATFDPITPAFLCLTEILRTSQSEVGHLERISKALHLLKELRTTLSSRVIQNSNSCTLGAKEIWQV